MIRNKIDQLSDSLRAYSLFPDRPLLYFSPETEQCNCCAGKLLIHKTSQKTVSTLSMGEFEANEIQKKCIPCKTIFRSQELSALTPHGGKFGFDVIEFIGRALFVRCKNEGQIQSELAHRNVIISENEISFLGKRFIVYLMLAHQASHVELKRYLDLKGSYILHMDGTCEGDSPHLFSCIDGLSNIVLGNQKMPTEDSQYIIPLLQHLKSDYGLPVACVHDMGNAILKTVKQVFPDIADFICHFHFLRDLGKDLFDFEYRTIRRYTRSYNSQAKLKKLSKQLKQIIDNDPLLIDSLDVYLSHQSIQFTKDSFDPRLSAYILISWVLEYNSMSNGLGFPFDRPHLEFYLRLKEAYPTLKQLKLKGVELASSDTSYHKMVKQIDKYWDKLFADPIEIETSSGKLMIQPQRTNNLMEQSFRFLKRDRRKKSGQHSLTKT